MAQRSLQQGRAGSNQVGFSLTGRGVIPWLCQFHHLPELELRSYPAHRLQHIAEMHSYRFRKSAVRFMAGSPLMGGTRNMRRVALAVRVLFAKPSHTPDQGPFAGHALAIRTR